MQLNAFLLYVDQILKVKLKLNNLTKLYVKVQFILVCES